MKKGLVVPARVEGAGFFIKRFIMIVRRQLMDVMLHVIWGKKHPKKSQ